MLRRFASLFTIVAAMLVLALPWTAQPPRAQIVPLNPIERANIQLALDNLDHMIDDILAGLPARPRTEAEARRKQATEAEMEKLRAIHSNLTEMLRDNRLRSVPGLREGRPRKYRQGGQVSSPWAAYCDDQTEVLDDKTWVGCREGDILVDASVLDPGAGTAIDESTQAGWEQKYRLQHIIAHEKMHEITVREAVERLHAQRSWEQKTPAQRAQLEREAKRNAATKDTHAEVYLWQKRVLLWRKRTLEDRLKALQRQKPPDKSAIDDLKTKIKWLADQHDTLETAMRNATSDHQFDPLETCGWPRGIRDGVIKLYLTSPGAYLRLDGRLTAGRTRDQTVGEFVWMGEAQKEAPITEPAASILVMPHTLFTDLHVQPEACVLLRERVGEVQVVDPKADLPALLAELTQMPPPPEPPALDDPPQEQTPAEPCPPTEKPEPIIVGRNDQVGSSARLRGKAASAAIGLVSGLLGGGGSSRAEEGPSLARCRIRERDMALFEDAASGVGLRAAVRRAGRDLVVFTRVDRSPDKGTFQAAYLQDAEGRTVAPSAVDICDLWGEWSASVSWTRSTYVDGALVNRESGGWSREGRFSIPGLRSSPERPDGLWRRLGFSGASHGARQVALRWRLPPEATREADLVVHVTRPGQDPVSTTPFVLRLDEAGGGAGVRPAEPRACPRSAG